MSALGFVAKEASRGGSSAQQGRIQPLTILGITTFILLLAVLHESGAIPTKEVFRVLFAPASQSPEGKTGPSLLAVHEKSVSGKELDDDEELDGDDEIERSTGAKSGSKSIESSLSQVGEVVAGGTGPFSQVIRDSRLLDPEYDGNQEGQSDSSTSGDGDAVNFNEVLSGLDGEDDAVISTGQIFGVRVQSGVGASSGGTGGTGAANPANPTPDPNETPRPWVTGQARGYTMLYAMHPKARAVVETQIATLLRARVREPYVGILIDGTFTRDFDYLRSIINRLSQDGRRLRLVLYLSNGPVMRRFETTKIIAPFSKIDPIRFRTLLRNDTDVREQVSRLVNDAARVFRYNLEVHQENSNVAIVMLEDNLDFDGYSRMRALAQRPLDKLAIFARSPCVGCYDGNHGDPQGDALEEHNLAFFNNLSRGDAYSFDGIGFAYPGQSQQGAEVSSSQLLEIMKAAVNKGLQYVGLWRGSWQGVTAGGELLIPDEREFVPSTPEQQLFEIRALREGLSEEVRVVQPITSEDDLDSDG